MIFESPTYGKLTKEEVFERLYQAILKKDGDYKVWIGTDSQNHQFTKMVLVVCLYNEGKGGKIFYHIDYLPKIRILNTKIYTETEMSLSLARDLNIFFHEKGIRQDVEIHADIGTHGPTKELIKPIVGWISSEGFIPKTKPYSVVASCVADRISK